MKVTVKLISKLTAERALVEDVIYKGFGYTSIREEIHSGIAKVLWEDDWVRLVPLDSKIQQISYRKDLVFAVIEEEDTDDTD